MILIGLGGNLPSSIGPPAATLEAALTELGRQGITLERRSGFYTSAAWPDPVAPRFVNAVAQVRTELSPEALLAALHDVEHRFGRQRSAPNAPRTLDLDLLDYDGRVQDGPPVLPHPRMSDRLFVLIPLREIAPDWRHPVSRKTAAELIAAAPSADIRPLLPSTG